MAAGRTEAACAACGVIELVDFVPRRLRDRREHQLRHAIAPRDGEVLRPVVDQDDLELAAIVAVDRARRIGHGNAMLESETRAGADLYLVACGDRDGQAGRDRVSLSGGDGHILCGEHIHPRGAVGCIGGQCQPFAVWQPLELHRNAISHRFPPPGPALRRRATPVRARHLPSPFRAGFRLHLR